MTDTPALPPPEADETAPAPPPAPRPAPHRPHNLVPAVYALGFVVLAMALVWIWQNPNPQVLRPEQISGLVIQVEHLTGRVGALEAHKPAGESELLALSKQVTALQEHQTAVQADVAALHKQVATQQASQPAAAPDLSALEQRLAALEARQPGTQPDLAPLEKQVAALHGQLNHLAQAGTPALGPVEQRLATLEQHVSALAALPDRLQATAQHLSAVGQHLDALAATQQHLGTALGNLDKTVAAQASGIDAQLAAVHKQAQQVAAAVHTATRLVHLQAARAALDAGEKLGPIEGAPPALARFADTAPPTAASLRLAFPDAAKAALAASRPATEGKPFGQRVLERAQSLITVREGDRVLVGDPAAGLLADARTKLGAGDLSGAVAAVDRLSGPAADAMAHWMSQAKALLAARAALDSMAAHA